METSEMTYSEMMHRIDSIQSETIRNLTNQIMELREIVELQKVIIESLQN